MNDTGDQLLPADRANLPRDGGQFLRAPRLTREAAGTEPAEEAGARLAAIEEANARLAAIVESSDDAIVGKTLAGVVSSWNSGAERIFGWTAAEAIGRSITFLIPPERLAEEDYILSRLRAGERIEHFETVRRRKDGRLIDVSLTVSPIRAPDGRIIGASKVARDISQRRRTEREREAVWAAERDARAAAESANRSKDEFLSMLSHELRTPLNSLLGWTIMLRDGRLDADATAEAVASIERNTRMLTRLVDDLLDISRVAAGKLALEPRPVLVASVVAAAVDSFRPGAAEKGLHLDADLQPGPLMASADPTRLQQVVGNLLHNAIKFTPRGGRVTVMLGAVNDSIFISVCDSGEGIAPEFLPRIFERFSQADSGKARRHGGLGLGLALVRHLVEMQGGSVRVDSEGLGKGATFTVRLPRIVETPG